MALGVVIVRLCTTIPVIGGWVKLAVIIWGLGAISIALYRRFQPVIYRDGAGSVWAAAAAEYHGGRSAAGREEQSLVASFQLLAEGNRKPQEVGDSWRKTERAGRRISDRPVAFAEAEKSSS